MGSTPKTGDYNREDRERFNQQLSKGEDKEALADEQMNKVRERRKELDARLQNIGNESRDRALRNGLMASRSAGLNPALAARLNSRLSAQAGADASLQGLAKQIEANQQDYADISTMQNRAVSRQNNALNSQQATTQIQQNVDKENDPLNKAAKVANIASSVADVAKTFL